MILNSNQQFSPRASNNLFYNILAVTIFFSAISFGYVIWQSGGAILFLSTNNNSANADQTLFSMYGLATPVSAQACDSTLNPSAPTTGGAIYYNSCVGKFRAYQEGRWKELSGYWDSTGSSLYPTLTSYNVGIGNTAPTSKLDVTGKINGNPSGLTGFSAREFMNINVASSISTGSGTIPNVTAVATSNAREFGIWYNTGATWADLLTTRLTASEICLPNNTSSSNCIKNWSDFTSGSSLWDYTVEGDVSSDVYNTNIWDPSIPNSGGNVNITRYLYVDGAIQIRNNAQTSLDWELDSTSVPTTALLNCSGANCAIRKMYSYGSVRAVLGTSGMAMMSTSSGTWDRIAANTGGNFTSIWVQNASNIWTNDSTHMGGSYVRGLARWQSPGNTWTYVCGTCSSTYSQTNANSKVWGFHGTSWDNYVYWSGFDTLRFYNPNANDFGTVTNASMSNISSIRGTSSGRFYALSDCVTAGCGSLSASPTLGQYTFTTGETSTKIHETRIISGLGYGINPTVLAVDEDFECSTCVVLAGSRFTTLGGNGTNVLIGNGGSTAGSWSANSITTDDGTSYNVTQVTWTDAWVGGRGQTIILSGTDTRKAGYQANVVLVSVNGGISWTLSRPDDEASSICSGTCLSYAVSGSSGNLYAAHYYNRIFYKGSGLPSGSLTVSGDISATNNVYESPKWSLGAGGTERICPDGQFAIGVKYSAGVITDIKCAKL